MSTDLPLPRFYAQTLTCLIPIVDDTLSTSSSVAQAILITALDDLYLISRTLTSLGVFSDNETIEELGDGQIVFMTLAWVIAECEAKSGIGGNADRIAALNRSEVGCPNEKA